MGLFDRVRKLRESLDLPCPGSFEALHREAKSMYIHYIYFKRLKYLKIIFQLLIYKFILYYFKFIKKKNYNFKIKKVFLLHLSIYLKEQK